MPDHDGVSNLNDQDLRVDIYEAPGGPDGGTYAVRVTHLPSGITAASDPHHSRILAKQEALERLKVQVRGSA